MASRGSRRAAAAECLLVVVQDSVYFAVVPNPTMMVCNLQGANGSSLQYDDARIHGPPGGGAILCSERQIHSMN